MRFAVPQDMLKLSFRPRAAHISLVVSAECNKNILAHSKRIFPAGEQNCASTRKPGMV